MATRYDWKALGFASQPDYRVAPNEGVVLYRCWGATSTEIGNGFFSMERPVSVYDAELKFNIADWGNVAARFVAAREKTAGLLILS